MRGRVLFINVPAMADGDEMKLVQFQVELVNNPIIADSNSVSIRALHPVMRKLAKARSHLIDFFLHSCLQTRRQGEESVIESLRENLGCRSLSETAHGLRTRTRRAAMSALPAAISS